MDFWSGESDDSVAISKQVFSAGKTNKLNLEAAISKGKAKVYFSSCLKDRKTFQVDDDYEPDGWTPTSSSNGEFVGLVL